jgi:hypothetical protein
MAAAPHALPPVCALDAAPPARRSSLTRRAHVLPCASRNLLWNGSPMRGLPSGSFFSPSASPPLAEPPARQGMSAKSGEFRPKSAASACWANACSQTASCPALVASLAAGGSTGSNLNWIAGCTAGAASCGAPDAIARSCAWKCCASA